MFNIPPNSSPEFQAFVTGMFLPFLSAALGFAISVIRKVISNLDHE